MGLSRLWRTVRIRSVGNLLMRMKPGGSTTSHLLLAATLWTVIGIGLSARGALWLAAAGKSWTVLPAIMLGCLKSFFILDKSAMIIIARIQKLADGSCLGGVYSPRTWALVLFMIMLGYLLRRSSMPLEPLGFIYVTIGSSLFLSSRLGWRAWLAAK